MNNIGNRHNGILLLLFIAVMWGISSCSTTRHLNEDQYLLRKNNITLKSEKILYNKGEVKDNLLRLITQKPNDYVILGLFPIKLLKYNSRYDRLKNVSDSALGKTKERPVVFDSASIPRSKHNMYSYLFNQGYFYAQITDSIVYRGKKAFVYYKINAGQNFLINKVNYDVDDSGIARVVLGAVEGSNFQKNGVFTFGKIDEERSRLSAVIRNSGYYQFTQENLRFVIDTMDKHFFRDIENPLENALNFIASSKSNRKPTVDLDVIIRTKNEAASVPYTISKVTVFPDYESADDRLDSTMYIEYIDSVLFKYHDPYVHSKVVADRVFLRQGQLYSQAEYDKTIAKLNELGIFQYIRIRLTENAKDSTLDCEVYLNRTKKLDFNANAEVSSGTNYQLGNSGGLSFRNKNFGKGANLLMVNLTGGIELTYNDNIGKDILDHFKLLTQYYGINASLDFPKFLAPMAARRFGSSNLPHTIVTAGSNVINRVNYFTLVNTTAYFKYNWNETQTKTWNVAPAFVSIVRLPAISTEFQARLDSNSFLRASYQETFIEGENITFTFTNAEKKFGRNFWRLKIGLEEAGGLLGGVNELGYKLNDLFKIDYAQYAKMDFDVQKFIHLPHSSFAFRFTAGIGLPYGQSSALPYIKQYYVGGPYSLRGWRIRVLGPGSFYDSIATSGTNILDHTGDIKLELNGEYRFPIIPLFAGTIKMNGALFSDAGNIWLARKNADYPGGEFAFNKLGSDIAVDVGAGSRFDIASFFTLRLDVAMPVRKPYVNSNSGWVFDQIAFSNSTWRANNIIINISIGYPF